MPAQTDATALAPIFSTITNPIQSTLLTNQTGQLLGNMQGQFGSSLANMQIRLLADFQKYLDPDETPFSSSVKTGETINQKKVEWGTGFLMPNKVTTNASGIAGTGSGTPPTTTVTLADANHYNRVQLGHILKNPVTGEHYYVTAKGASNQITVARGFANTTAVADANTRELEMLAPAMYENMDTPFVGVAKGALEWNAPILIDRGIWVSERENNTPDYEFKGGSKYDAYLEKTMKEVAILFEKHSIMGRRNISDPIEGVTSAAYFPSTMGGLDQFTPLYYDLGGTPITEYALQNMLFEAWTDVGDSNVPTTLLVGGFVNIALSTLWNSNRIADVKDSKINLTWKEVEMSFGKLRWKLSRYIPAGAAYLVNMDDISKHFYRNGAWKEVRLPAAGPYLKGRFTGDVTMMFRRSAARRKLLGISTNPAHYPNL